MLHHRDLCAAPCGSAIVEFGISRSSRFRVILGKLELLKLRSDAFLAHGDPAIAIDRKELLGKSDDGRLL